MKLEAPLKLKAIRTKSYASGSVAAAIQLVFSNGLESPIFDAQSTNSSADKEFTSV